MSTAQPSTAPTSTAQRSTYVISITPFSADGSLDADGLRAHLGRMRAAGVGVYVAGGGSGEAYTLTTDETETVLRVAVEELKGRVPVRAMGVEPRSADEMVRFIGMAERAGVDATQIYSLDGGHGWVPRPDELEGYYRDILSEVRSPVVLSSHQSVGYWLPVPVIERLVERHDNIIGINVTHPDVTYLVRVVEAVGDQIEVHVGGPMQGLTALALGATGFLTSEANLAPRLCQSVISHWEAGDHANAAAAFSTLLRLFTALSEAGGLAATKAALAHLGLPGGTVRKPRLLPTDVLEKLAPALLELDIPQVEDL